MTTDLILGTAGHIDHGKTSLIRALTGVETDRLPEEKQRGITIELGFAELSLPPYRLGIVDVPGHERFVRNMLCGATGVDVAMLVVAADDSVKPQTREHFEILRLLGLPAGVIALTKSDLVDPEWLPLVVDDIEQLVEGSFLEGAPIIATSATTGEGLPQLCDAIRQAAAISAEARQALIDAPFRLAIDRTFSATGHGTVITGSVASGAATVGDQLMIEPAGIAVRVRGLQNHDRQVERVTRGQRAAVNLAGVKVADVGRGQELATPGHLQATRTLTVRLDTLAENQRPLKNRQRLRVHLGSGEYLATLWLLEDRTLEPGQTAYAQLLLREPAVAIWRQPFVVRSESPVTTVGGGVVLSPDAARIRRPQEQDLSMLGRMLSPEPRDRAEASAYFADLTGWDSASLNRNAGIVDHRATAKQLVDDGVVEKIAVSNAREMMLHTAALDRLGSRICESLTKLHDQTPLALGFDRLGLAQRFSYVEPAIFEAVVQRLVKNGRARRIGQQLLGLSDRGPRLSNNERKLYQQLIQWLEEAGVEAPFVDELSNRVTKNRDSVPSLLEIAVSQGDVVAVTDKYFLHCEVDQALQQKLAEASRNQTAGMTLSEIRNIMETSRKYAVPYCEYLDRIGVTTRAGDVRQFAKDS